VDPQSRVKIFALLRELHDAGKTIIYTTHYMEEAERLCDRIGIIDHGKLLAEGTLSELLAHVNLPRCVRVFVSVDAIQLPDIEFAGRHTETDHTDYTPKRPEQLGQLVSYIEQSGMHYDRMEIVGPNLETLFLQLTGKELRDV
jgi:ABC-2 type transport system ATP-binding protein